MKERPILFTGPMVRAILEGRKTVTRRVVKPQPDFLGSMVDPNTPFKTLDAGLHARITCPHGQPGDRLWVREAWAADAQVDAIAPRDLSQGEPIWYPADFSVRQTGCSMISKGRGRPSIHMPRWASRILLEIIAVRVDRLHGITPNQCIAEGAWREKDKELGRGQEAIAAFADLWRSTGGDWDANPWVWVIEFKRVTP
ncbi:MULTISPECIES: hypothetical protein [Pseudomonas aeruginosa group]|uniref:hypothetical protein n=1 Tax=Pseudomonas aeruginosa group TaxID=136841 RepID=UPI0006B289A5|nr:MULTISPECIES: hypothetical protein [Pseudomonas aeruginosa group]KPD29182.1 hypothetical protein AN920_11740 [Pseudomonas paraeruginosa]KQB31370.1 hypothetical protein AOA77_17265 [Pseudomonas paraeruginosa]MDT1026454.1 hypothetical protein [Pseudomonas paraeruginosa]PHJ33541.1 hypothetical protein CDG78_04290 [Pseudomonas paraeruginosa]QQV51084.1 hypothetical protein JHW37_12380 [Pseudomonas aeruginosa]